MEQQAGQRNTDPHRGLSCVSRVGLCNICANKLRGELAENPAFFRITRNTFLHGLGVWMAAAVRTLFWCAS